MPPPFYRNGKVFYQKFHTVSIRPIGKNISEANINIADERENEFSFLLTAIRQLHFSDLPPQVFYCHFPLSTRCLSPAAAPSSHSSVFIRHLIVGRSLALLGDLAFRFNPAAVNFIFAKRLHTFPSIN